MRKEKNKCNFTNRELLDCPFCENEYDSPIVTMSYYNEYLGRQYFVECTNCGATSAHRADADYVVDAWNRRRDNDKR